MAHLIVVCPRAGTGVPFDPADLQRCAAAIAPDNIEPHDPLIHAEAGLLVGVVNPVAGIPMNDGSVCLGRVFGPSDGWWRLGAEAPDGNYAIVRTSERAIELLTDILATRPVWYVQTERAFLASTSQRALVMLLRSFELEHEAVTWMLACGHLGAMSWDRRLRRMPGDCRLTLDRESWHIRLDLRPADREPHPSSDQDHVTVLREAISGTCESLDLHEREWLLTLSGGLDSRVLLMALVQAGKSPRCVTWGLKSSLTDRKTDAWVASELASALGIQHRYYPTDAAPGTVEVALHRFLTVGEGQSCLHFEPYADGMAMWKAFFESGVCGVVRGDEPGLGYYSSQASQIQVRRRMQIILVPDYSRDHPIHRLGLAEQHLNEDFSPHPGESLRSWDERIYEELEYPSILAPLNSLKSGFVEVVNPLQSRRVTEVARKLPDPDAPSPLGSGASRPCDRLSSAFRGTRCGGPRVCVRQARPLRGGDATGALCRRCGGCS